MACTIRNPTTCPLCSIYKTKQKKLIVSRYKLKNLNLELTFTPKYLQIVYSYKSRTLMFKATLHC